MANYFNIELDTTGPLNPTIIVEGGGLYSPSQLIDLALSTSDGDTTGYQMKVWGDVDVSYNANVQDIEVNSEWITYNIAYQIKLSSGDGSKDIYFKIKDDVYNESAQDSTSVILDTTLPVANIIGPDVDIISKINGKNVSSFSFTTDTIFDEYKVKVVGASGSTHDTGTLILTSFGSVHTNGSGGDYSAATPIDVQITGTDLENASGGDGVKIIKVFIKDKAGNWSA